VLPHAPEVVWKTLTTSELIGRWLMPNDFAPEVGKRFTFRTKPMGDWDGVVHCEVIAVEPNRKLVFSWAWRARRSGCTRLSSFSQRDIRKIPKSY